MAADSVCGADYPLSRPQPEMKATLFREMMQTPGMALFNEIGPKVGKSGSQVKDQWRNTLMPMILKVSCEAICRA